MYQIFDMSTGHWLGWDYQDTSDNHQTFSIQAPCLTDDGVYWCDPQSKILKIIGYRPSVDHYFNGNEWVVNSKEVELRQLQVLKNAKIAALKTAAQDMVNKISGANLIPDFELSTWPLQSAEGQAWAADKSAVTPILDGIAAARGIEASKLREAALRKSLEYSALAAHVAGQRQALQSKIEAAKTKDELDKIKIEFTAPPEAV